MTTIQEAVEAAAVDIADPEQRERLRTCAAYVYETSRNIGGMDPLDALDTIRENVEAAAAILQARAEETDRELADMIDRGTAGDAS